MPDTMTTRSGTAEGVPYSLSRWTDVPAAKWEWFRSSLADGRMQAFDPRTAVPEWWSLKPQDVHSLVFWTKDPRNLVRDRQLIEPYRVKLHVTITDWSEVEPGVPAPVVVAASTAMVSDRIGKENVTWRFSPVPLLDASEVFDRFDRIAQMLQGSTDKVYLSFLQLNDRVSESREPKERARVTAGLTAIGRRFGMQVFLCNDDRTLSLKTIDDYGIQKGVCVPCEGEPQPAAESCGCAIMVDPFTINETCTMGCLYCYAADKNLAPKKHNSTKGLPVVK